MGACPPRWAGCQGARSPGRGWCRGRRLELLEHRLQAVPERRRLSPHVDAGAVVDRLPHDQVDRAAAGEVGPGLGGEDPLGTPEHDGHHRRPGLRRQRDGPGHQRPHREGGADPCLGKDSDHLALPQQGARAQVRRGRCLPVDRDVPHPVHRPPDHRKAPHVVPGQEAHVAPPSDRGVLHQREVDERRVRRHQHGRPVRGDPVRARQGDPQAETPDQDAPERVRGRVDRLHVTSGAAGGSTHPRVSGMASRVTRFLVGEPAPVRDPLLDNARYLVLLLVIAGHALAPLRGPMDGVFAGYVWLYAFHMPLFVLLSGYTARSYRGEPRQVRRMVGSLVWPFLLIGSLLGSRCR